MPVSKFRKFPGLPGSRRAGVSIAVVLALIIVVGAAGTGIFFVAAPHNANQSASPEQQDSLSTMTSTVATTSSLPTSTVASAGQPQTVFGFVVNSSADKTAVFPSDTMMWTNYVLSSSSQITGITTAIITTPSSPELNVIMAIYVNGNLISEENYQIGPPVPPSSSPDLTLPSNFTQANEVTVPLGTTVQAGATISVAIWSNGPLTIQVDNADSTAHGTYQYALPSSTISLPQSLPSSTQSMSSAPDFWAFDQGQ